MEMTKEKIDTLLDNLRHMLETEKHTLFQIFNDYTEVEGPQGIVEQRILAGRSVVLHFGNSSEATLKQHLLNNEPFARNCWVIDDA